MPLRLVQLLLAGPGRFRALQQVGGIFVCKIGHELVIDDFPGPYVTRAGDQSNQDADGKPTAEGDPASANVFSIGTHSEEHHERREHDPGVAEDLPFLPANLIGKGMITSISAADIAPEISPKISTVFFIEFKSPSLSIPWNLVLRAPKCTGRLGRYGRASFGFGGSHNSMRLPSGSAIQAKRPQS